jgi:hypothetical protein
MMLRINETNRPAAGLFLTMALLFLVTGCSGPDEESAATPTDQEGAPETARNVRFSGFRPRPWKSSWRFPVP